MKKILFALSALLLMGGSLMAQRFAYVDSEYILNNIPSYKAAQDQINELSQEWEGELKKEYEAIDKMYKDYQAEKVLLNDEMKKKREDAIIQKEKEVKELQKKYFGPEGELFQKRQELIKPVQDEVYKAVQEMALEGNYAVVFDTASGPAILYSNPKNDKSDEILERLGYKN